MGKLCNFLCRINAFPKLCDFIISVGGCCLTGQPEWLSAKLYAYIHIGKRTYYLVSFAKEKSGFEIPYGNCDVRFYTVDILSVVAVQTAVYL